MAKSMIAGIVLGGVVNSVQGEFPQRWKLDEDHGLVCVMDGTDPFKARPNVDFVTHGHRVILRVSLPVDDGTAEVLVGPRVQWPIFKQGVRDKDLVIPGAGSRKSDLPMITVDGMEYGPGRRMAYGYNGLFKVQYAMKDGLQATRTYFPSYDKRIAFQGWQLENGGGKAVVVDVPAVRELIWKRKAVDDREWNVDYVVTPLRNHRLEPGKKINFGVAYAAYPADEAAPEFDLDAERKAGNDLVARADRNLVLSTPDTLLNRAFHLAKVRTMLSNIETRAGLLNTTGSMAYYCGFWANDNAEYASPFIPLLGSDDLNNGLDTMYRVWLEDIQKYAVEEMQITGSFETYNLIPYQRGRGDEAMIIYGLSRYLLLRGDRKLAEEMWPLVQRCGDDLSQHLNEAGVVASRTDELEGRLPTGTANLSTSALAYDGLNSASRLADALGKADEAKEFRQAAQALDTAMESYFGAVVEGFDTYRYYEGNDKLRGWISLPVVAGITRRQEQTLDALFSDKLWLEDEANNNVNLKALSTEADTHWSRETYYALLAAYKAGRTELATDKLHRALTSHILGAGGPVADEDSIDLLAPTILFSRVVTEGLFGIEPVDFGSFRCRPRLPKGWPSMELNRVNILGEVVDIHVRRAGRQVALKVLKEGAVLFSDTGLDGTGFDVRVKSPEAGFTDAVSKEAAALATRVLGDRARTFRFQTIPSADGKDVFELESKDGKIIIGGNNGVSMASGLNWYLTRYGNCQVSLNNRQLSLPKTLPAVASKVRNLTPFQRRNFFNYCTFGYTMPWWDWPRWEQMIDYMAMQGVNMPLAMTGQEAVWQEVFLEMGLTQSQLDDFFVGPAYLPWGWMSNIDGLGGPLPQGWIDGQKSLQQQILARQRRLGMTPILQGFSGHVPVGIKESYPDARIHKVTDWACMPGVHLLDPLDPLFREIGKRFIEKQTELYGTDHLYNADCFNEVNPPTNDTGFIANVGQSVYGAMTDADPDAIWVFQGWFLFWQRDFWQKPQASALLSAVPNDRMIGLDLYGERNPVWDKTEAFYGKQWIWNVICNQGQKVNLSGNLQVMEDNLQTALTSPDAGKLVGIGLMMEGFGYNPIIQEYILSKTWSPQPTDPKQWVQDYAIRRYGIDHPKTKEAWTLMLEGPYSRNILSESKICYTPSLSGKVSGQRSRHDNSQYDLLKATEALAALLECSDRLRAVDTYRFDLVHITREMLANYAELVVDKMNLALAARDAVALRAAGDEFLAIIRDMDAICGTNEQFMLGKWIEEAKAKATHAADRALYEFNARSILTMWQPSKNSCLRDYASRQWHGLLGDFYYVRWQRYLDGLVTSLENGTDFDFNGYVDKIKDFEMEWIRQTNDYPHVPVIGPAVLAANLLAKYHPLQVEALAAGKALAEAELRKNTSMATGKVVTCSGGTQGSHVPENTVDGDLSNASGWHCESAPSWLQVDLGEIRKVDTIKLYTYHDDKRHYTYFIEVSTDGQHYDEVVNMRSNTTPSTGEGFEHHFNPMDVRYVRVTMVSNSANPGVHINEIMVH